MGLPLVKTEFHVDAKVSASQPIVAFKRHLRLKKTVDLDMNNKIDETDWQLIQLLKDKGRESSANLGRELNLARTTVAARIARLEREGIIKGYSVRLSSSAESATVRAYCSISVTPRSGVSVIRALDKMFEVEEVSAVSGQFDYVAFLRCSTHENLDELLDRIGNLEGVHLTQTSVILNRKIDRRSTVS